MYFREMKGKSFSSLEFKITPSPWITWFPLSFFCISLMKYRKLLQLSHQNSPSPNVSTTPITAMGCWQCLPLSVVQLKGKHCHNGVVDTFGQCLYVNVTQGNQMILTLVPLLVFCLFASTVIIKRRPLVVNCRSK